MHEYDVALKLLLQGSSVLRQITGGIEITEWLNPEFPQVQANPRPPRNAGRLGRQQ